MNQVRNSLIENLQLVIDNVKYELNAQLMDKLHDQGKDLASALRLHLDAVKEHMDQRFDSHAPITGVESIEETM